MQISTQRPTELELKAGSYFHVKQRASRVLWQNELPKLQGAVRVSYRKVGLSGDLPIAVASSGAR